MSDHNYFRRSFDMHWTDYVPGGYDAWKKKTDDERERRGREAWVLGNAKQRILDLEARVEALERAASVLANPQETPNA